MLTLVKWIRNPNEQSSNRIITRTLGKIGVIPSKVLFEGRDLPRKNEYWYSEIVCETKPDNLGVFVLRPIKHLSYVPNLYGRGRRPDFQYLIPGTFDCIRKRNAVLVYPQTKGPNWICNSNLRQFLLNMHRQQNGRYGVNAVIIVFDNAEDWITQGLEEFERVTGSPVRPIPGAWTAARNEAPGA